MGTIVWEDGCHEWVGDGFQGTVCVSEDKAAPEEHAVGVGWPGGEGHDSGEDVTEESEDNEFSVPKLIDDQTTDDDTKAEAGESCTGDGAELLVIEAKLLFPVIEDTAADCEADPCSEDRHKTSPQQAVGIGDQRPG